MSLSRWMFKGARFARDAEAISSGDPKRVSRRIKNKIIGRALGRAGVWKRLWG